MLALWILAAVELFQLYACFAAQTCYTIDAVDVRELCSASIPIQATLTIDNPNSRSWLRIGSVHAQLTSYTR